MRAEAAAAAKGKRTLGRGFHHCALPGASARKRASYDDCGGRIANPLPHAIIAGMPGDRRDLPAGLAGVTHYESHRAMNKHPSSV